MSFSCAPYKRLVVGTAEKSGDRVIVCRFPWSLDAQPVLSLYPEPLHLRLGTLFQWKRKIDVIMTSKLSHYTFSAAAEIAAVREVFLYIFLEPPQPWVA